jgi:hypothetical protein
MPVMLLLRLVSLRGGCSWSQATVASPVTITTERLRPFLLAAWVTLILLASLGIIADGERDCKRIRSCDRQAIAGGKNNTVLGFRDRMPPAQCVAS